MKAISIQQVRQATGGKAVRPIPSEVGPITAIDTDTRHLKAGALFVALRGGNHDGHDFLPQAAAAGAVAALVERLPAQETAGLHLIEVPDTRQALGKLGRMIRQQVTAKVIAVGGANGKTGTKHLIDAVLRTSLRGTISPKSFNNDIGVPLAIFAADPHQDYLVLEMGTNHHGEMRVLTGIGLPDVAVITNISAEHLEGLGDLMGVRREEASIVEGLHPKGLLIVNGDDADLLEAVSIYPGRRITFGLKESNDLFATDIRCTWEGVHFRLNGRADVFVPLLGKHVAVNALAAIAVGRRLGLPEVLILEGLAKATGPAMRLELQTIGSITLLNDAYNANPASMKAALETLMALPSSGRRLAVLGDMRELGEASDQLHREVGEFAGALALDRLICVGEQAALIAEAARQVGLAAERIVRFGDTATAARAVPEWLSKGDLVLLKGSRGMQLEVIAEAITTAAARRAAS